MKKNFLGYDFGASSGRAMLGVFDGEKIELSEVHRFSNDPVMLNGRFVWDVQRLFYEVKQALLKISHMGIQLDAIGIDTWGVDYGLLDQNGYLLGVPVNYRDDLTVNVDDIVSALTPDVQLLVLLNPNNPVGDAYSEGDMERIMRAAFANEVTVLIDEAYHYLYPNTFLHYALEHDNVFVTRTFSKLFSLAGLRLGSVIGRPAGVEVVRKLCVPHNVNAFAIRFAQALIDRPELVEQLVAAQTEGKAYLVAELEKRGYDYVPSNGNFMFFKPRTNPDVLVERMRDDAGILVKSYHGVGRLGACMRLTTAERRFMERFVEALDELDR